MSRPLISLLLYRRISIRWSTCNKELIANTKSGFKIIEGALAALHLCLAPQGKVAPTIYLSVLDAIQDRFFSSLEDSLHAPRPHPKPFSPML